MSFYPKINSVLCFDRQNKIKFRDTLRDSGNAIKEERIDSYPKFIPFKTIKNVIFTRTNIGILL